MARREAVAWEGKLNTMWAYATMGQRPVERVLGTRECNSQEAANTVRGDEAAMGKYLRGKLGRGSKRDGQPKLPPFTGCFAACMTPVGWLITDSVGFKTNPVVLAGQLGV